MERTQYSIVSHFHTIFFPAHIAALLKLDDDDEEAIWAGLRGERVDAAKISFCSIAAYGARGVCMAENWTANTKHKKKCGVESVGRN